jgi:hypothetical protein
VSSRTIHNCDTCGAVCQLDVLQQFTTANLEGLKTFDICQGCVRAIVMRVIDGKPVILRPLCTKCFGTGRIGDWEPEDYHRNKKVYHKCEECKLI